MSAAFEQGRCWVCGQPVTDVKKSARCCRRPECRSELMDADTVLLLRYILETSEWSGGPGWRVDEAETREYGRRMERAISQLPRDAEPLAILLIELLGVAARGQQCYIPAGSLGEVNANEPRSKS
jgi:hypothetical protein